MMPISVKKTKATSKTTSSELDFLTGVVADSRTKDKIKDEVGNYLVEQTLLALADAKSPVTSEKFKALSPDYAIEKREQGSPAISNMELRGKMLEDLTFKPTSKGVEIGFLNSKEAEKADGHNNFSGKSKLAEIGKQRRFLPGEGQTYKDDIEREVNKIITDIVGASVPVTRSMLGQITSRTSFWTTFTAAYPDFSRNEIRGLFKRSAKLSALLGEFDLLEFLD